MGTALRSFFRSRGWTHISLSSFVHQEELQPLLISCVGWKEPKTLGGWPSVLSHRLRGYMKLPQLSGLIKVQHSICTQISDSYTPFVCSAARPGLLYCEISARRGVGAVSYQILMESGLRWERKDSSSHFLVTPEKRGIVGLLTWTHQIHNSWVMLNSLANMLLAATTTHRWTVFPSKNVSPIEWRRIERMNEYKDGCCKLEISSSAAAAVDLRKITLLNESGQSATSNFFFPLRLRFLQTCEWSRASIQRKRLSSPDRQREKARCIISTR